MKREFPSCSDRYSDNVKMRRLVGLCRELQAKAEAEKPDSPFYITCRDAGHLCDLDHTTASKYLSLLVIDGILKVIEKGSQKKATRYRYLPPLDE